MTREEVASIHVRMFERALEEKRFKDAYRILQYAMKHRELRPWRVTVMLAQLQTAKRKAKQEWPWVLAL